MELFLIKDTQTGEFKRGAKDQYAFDCKGKAKRSLIHTDWWKEYQRDYILKEDGKGQLLADRDFLKERYYEFYKNGGHFSVPQKLRDDIQQNHCEINKARNDCYKRQIKFPSFKDQTRFEIHRIKNIDTEPVK